MAVFCCYAMLSGVARSPDGCLVDRRAPARIDHEIVEMPRFRMFGIVADCEDADDCDSLRADPAGRAPASCTRPNALSDRTSCRSPRANQFRLILHTGAYWLVHSLRAAIPKASAWATAEFTTLRPCA